MRKKANMFTYSNKQNATFYKVRQILFAFLLV